MLQRAFACNQLVVLVLRDSEQARQWRKQEIRVVEGDACEPCVIANACQTVGSDATIVSTLGGGPVNYLSHRTLIDGAERAGLKHMLLVMSLGCGDSWSLLSARAKAAFGLAVREKSLGELLDMIATYNGQLTQRAATLGLMWRQDVAFALERLLLQPVFGNHIYNLIDPCRTLTWHSHEHSRCVYY